ncbi:MAG: DUF5667 domain-containing protein [Chloroflexota bacterium]|nr:DUF5667 domain-containing protein [Chloroflexota bacterium]
MSERRSPLLERPVMREQFRNELRGRLMSEAVVALAPRPNRFSLPALLRPALAAAVILVLILAGATSAAASSLPGDPLYTVKRASEDVRLAVTFDQVARLLLLSDLADRRLEELAEVALQRPAAAPAATQEYADAVERVAQALEEADGSNNDGANNQQGQNVEAAQTKRLATLDSIKGTIPDNARAGVEKLIQRERDRNTRTPTAPPGTEGTSGGDDQKDGGDAKEATPRATPNPKRATPAATPRSRSNEDGNNEDHN